MKVLIFSPHSDDVDLSLGGSIKNGLLGKDISIYTVFSVSNYTIINKGNADRDITTSLRKAEEIEYMNNFNIKVNFLDYPEPLLRGYESLNKIFDSNADPELDSLFSEIYEKILNICNENKDSVLFFPLSLGSHIDHIILAKIGLKIMNSKNLRVCFYEDQPYAGGLSLTDISQRAISFNKHLVPLRFNFGNYLNKVISLKIYKSQLDSEDSSFTYYHTQRRKGEVIWVSVSDKDYFCKCFFNLDELSGLVRPSPSFFDGQKRIKIISEFFNLTEKEVLDELKMANNNIAREWKYFSGENKEINFYEQTAEYILELEDWHINDKMKQAGIITIASQCRNKKFLEYGCGIADTAILAALNGASESHALDLPSKTMDYAKFRESRFLSESKIKFIESPNDIDSLVLPNEYYDVVSAEDVFEHLTNPEKHALKIYNSLKSGGSLFFSTEFIHSDFHPMHLKSNDKFNGIQWLYALENIGFDIISPCQAIKL